MRRASRILSIALITAGLVIMADVVVTIAWTEPVSAIYGEILQSEAEDDLEARSESFRADQGLSDGESTIAAARAARLAARYGDRISEGDAIGRIRIERTGTDLVFVQGTQTDDLRTGPGHYGDTGLPGAGETVGIAGHRTTYGAPFHDIDDLREGDEIVLEMPYGTFTYVVTGHEIVSPSRTEVLRDTGTEQVVLTACHPLYSAAERYVVSARIESSRG